MISPLVRLRIYWPFVFGLSVGSNETDYLYGPFMLHKPRKKVIVYHLFYPVNGWLLVWIYVPLSLLTKNTVVLPKKKHTHLDFFTSSEWPDRFEVFKYKKKKKRRRVLVKQGRPPIFHRRKYIFMSSFINSIYFPSWYTVLLTHVLTQGSP